MSQNQPVSWRSVIYGTPVMSSDNQPVGNVHEVLGDDAEDIFHGLRVSLSGGHRDVMISADDVDNLGSDAVRVSLTEADIELLPPYAEEATYHLASVGWLRKHIGWKKDSQSDEEPG
ncbi:MAG TPA: PRC-barrel domain-containing protein [Candidatus Limnocylindrales bacterium]